VKSPVSLDIYLHVHATNSNQQHIQLHVCIGIRPGAWGLGYGMPCRRCVCVPPAGT
jgi:hypothetical protein